VAVAEIEQDVGDLRDHLVAGIEIGRREGRAILARLHVGDQRVAALVAGDIDIGDAAGLHRQPDELAPALDFGPVPELVRSCLFSRCAGLDRQRVDAAASRSASALLTNRCR
jgi:hypothetical protein